METLSLTESEHRSPLRGFMPFFWLALAAVSGIVLADWLKLPKLIWAAGMGISTLLWLLTLVLPKPLPLTHYLRVFTRSDRRLPGGILAAVFFLGGWLFGAVQPTITPDHAAYYNDRGVVQLVGQVVQLPDYRDTHTNLTVLVESLQLFEESLQNEPIAVTSGLVLIQVPPGNDWAYGYRLRVTGLLQTPFDRGDFSYQNYLARKGIHSMMFNARIDSIEFTRGNIFKAYIFDLRSKAYAVLHDQFPSPELDLMAGILLGQDQGLSPDLQEAFRRTGTTHIIAISGFNIAILAGLFSGLATRLLGRKRGALTAIVGITAYTLMVGGDAAVVRAAIMGGLGVLGGMFGRRQNGLNSLGLAVMAMALINPNILWDVGFQMSVSATLGLILYAQPLEEWLVQRAKEKMSEEQAQRIAGPIGEFLLFTLAAQVMTLPVMAYHFGGMSWVAIISNPLILPPQSFVMVLGGLALLAGMVLPVFGQVLAMVALPFVSYTIRMVIWLASFPVGNLVLPDFHILWIIIFYGLLFVLTLFSRDDQRKIFGKIFSHQTGMLLLTGLVIFVWNRVLSVPDGELHLTLLDSEGTVLIQSPSGNTVLIGGGPRPSHLKQVLGQRLYAGDRSIDILIVGSTAREDLNGLTGALKTNPVDMAVLGVDPDANQTTRTVYALLAERGVPLKTMEQGQSLDLGDGVLLTVLSSEARGSVLWLEWENFSALLPTGKVEGHLLKAPDSPSLLLLRDGMRSEDLPILEINLWSPEVILLAIEESDLSLQGEHELIDLLAGYPVVSTLDHGWVRISTDGDHVWVQGD